MPGVSCRTTRSPEPSTATATTAADPSSVRDSSSCVPSGDQLGKLSSALFEVSTRSSEPSGRMVASSERLPAGPRYTANATRVPSGEKTGSKAEPSASFVGVPPAEGTAYSVRITSV